MANKDFKVKNGLDIQSPLPVSMGGTGQTSTTNTLNSLLPSQSGNSSKVLQTDGTNTTWATPVKGLTTGSTAQRPGSPSNGDLYFNTDEQQIEVYQNGNWLIANITPGIPTGVTATNQGTGRAYNNGQASVAFTAATSGGPVKTFTVTPSPATSPTTFTGTSSPISVTGLSSSTQYTYTVTAGNNIGTSSASSASSGVTATTVPQAPSLSAASADSSAVITITPGATGGAAISQYSIISNPVTTTQTTSNTSYTFTGLTNGTAYTFTATATNTNGTSTSSSASNSITPAIPVFGAYDSIAAAYITTDNTVGGIEFTSLPQNYSHLQIRIVARRSDSPGSNDTSGIYFIANSNDSTATNYAVHGTNGQVGGFYTYGSANTTYFGRVETPLGGSAAGLYGVGVMDINDYSSTSKNKTIKMLQGAVGSSYGFYGPISYLYSNTSAIKSIYVTTFSGYFAAGTTISIYGVK